WLLLFPCWWGAALATDGWPDPWLISLFAVGAVVMRGAGCTYNDIVDRDFDARVARTADRPIPSGAISVVQAVAFMIFLLALGLAVLLQLNSFAIGIGALSLVLVFTYPLAKRVTYWPQAVLGLTFNWGALIGWAAVQGSLDSAAFAIYAAGFFWTLGYDTIYAHQDKKDDLLIGVKSSALQLGTATRPWLFAFYAVTALLLGAAGWLSGLGWPWWIGLCAATTHMAWQAWRVDIDSPANCLTMFRANQWIGMIVLAGIVAAKVWNFGLG
ncbi:MAG: 4-hydroxybenzoate octaprenyltransferase, partial [Rhodospirillales bacterium]